MNLRPKLPLVASLALLFEVGSAFAGQVPGPAMHRTCRSLTGTGSIRPTNFQTPSRSSIQPKTACSA